VRFENDGSHTTAYETTVDDLRVRIDADGINVAISDSDG